MASVKIESIEKSYGGMKTLKGIDIDIEDGEFLVLVGPSGCGKSTLLHSICGLETIDTGRIYINNKDVTDHSPKDRDVAMVFQSYALYPNMTVKDNIAFGLEMRGMPRADRYREVQRVSEMLEISHLLDRKPSALSGGQRQRVAMGRALARRPDLYLFAAPLSNLDARLRVAMRTQIKKLHKQIATTMIYVTHDQVEAMTLADRIALLDKGVVQQIGTPEDVYLRPKNRFVASFIGSPSMNFVDGLVSMESGRGVFRHKSGNESLSLPRPLAQKMVDDGREQVTLGIRPEHLRVSGQVLEDSFEFDVEFHEPTGADTMVFGNWGQENLVCRMNPEEAKNANGRISLGFDIETAHFFDSHSGETLLFS